MSVVVFSVAGTLGSLFVRDGDPARARLEPHPHVVALLRRLRQDEIRIGIEIPDERFDRESMARLIGAAGLAEWVDSLLIERPPFDAALLAEGPRVFVSRDRVRRAGAGAPFRRVPDTSLVVPALGAESFSYLRASPGRLEAGERRGFSWRSVTDGLALAPLHVTVEQGAPVLYAVAGRRAIAELSERVELERIGEPDLPEQTDLVLFQTSFSSPAGREFLRRLRRLPLFRETTAGAVVALDAEQTEGEFHPPDDAHGHTRTLRADTALVETAGPTAAPESSSLPDKAKTALAGIDAALLQANLAPWLGGNEGQGIASRFLYHPDNPKAVTALGGELGLLLGSSDEHDFTLNGSYQNVVGDLAGDPAGGHAEEIVIVAAHLDSTAARDSACTLPADSTCLAPGADDDASGIAAVLSIARKLKQLADGVGAPRRTIRFAFFNAEEQGMVGSDAYASDLAAQGKQVAAMFQLDMIGTPGLGASESPNGTTIAAPPWILEIHTAGWEDLGTVLYDVYDQQESMRAALVESAGILAPELTVRNFPVAGCELDPGSGRSDHSSFQKRGFPACYLAEELWTEDCPGAMRSHPTYHSSNDKTIDAAYAAAIARTVAGAVWIVANP